MATASAPLHTRPSSYDQVVPAIRAGQKHHRDTADLARRRTPSPKCIARPGPLTNRFVLGTLPSPHPSPDLPPNTHRLRGPSGWIFLRQIFCGFAARCLSDLASLPEIFQAKAAVAKGAESSTSSGSERTSTGLRRGYPGRVGDCSGTLILRDPLPVRALLPDMIYREHGEVSLVTMRISTKGDYATRALLALALRGGPVSVRDIAALTGLPQAYLEQIMLGMKAAGLVEAKRGVQGGYSLARPASQITLRQIVEAAEGNVAPLGCAAEEPDRSCVEEGQCALQLVWIRVRGAVSDILDSVTLQEVAEDTLRIKESLGRKRTPLTLSPSPAR